MGSEFVGVWRSGGNGGTEGINFNSQSWGFGGRGWGDQLLHLERYNLPL